MFDIMKVGKNIREARIAQDMTQMDLADAMAVSYQAVSNWERGNSMPDIAKLEQLCHILRISIDQLLGAEDGAKTVTKIIHREEGNAEGVTIEEIGEIAPLLKPKEMKKLVSESLQEDSGQDDASGEREGLGDGREKKKKKVKSATFIRLAPFLGTEDLDELLQDLEEEMDMKTIISLAPFLSQHSVDDLALRVADQAGIKAIKGLAPFLSQKGLEELLGRCDCDGEEYLDQVVSLAPFLSDIFLEGQIQKLEKETDMEMAIRLAPFLSQHSVDDLALRVADQAGIKAVKGLAPFLSQKCLEELLGRCGCDEEEYLDQVMSFALFLNSSFLRDLIRRAED